MLDPPPLDFSPMPIARNAEGAVRRVGVEVEFTRLGVGAAAGALAAALDGGVHREDPYAYHVQTADLGQIGIELDVRHVHPFRLADHPRPWIQPPLSTWLGAVLSPFVPRELVTEPITIDRLPAVDRALRILRKAGAAGRGVTLFDSLGLHFNIEPPAVTAGALLAILRAFILLEPSLRARCRPTACARWHMPPPFPALR